jgi:hypothetical protein
MRFFDRIASAVSKGSRAPERRCTGLRRSRIELEVLEGRALMSGIQGVTLTFYGNLSITAPKTSGNMAVVSIDASTHNVEVSLNGQSEEFKACSVYSITYVGGSGGKDTFTNDTSLTELAYGYGGNNDFTAGTGCSAINFWGSDNTLNTVAGSYGGVIEHGGTGDTVTGAGDFTVYK